MEPGHLLEAGPEAHGFPGHLLGSVDWSQAEVFHAADAGVSLYLREQVPGIEWLMH